MQEASFFGVAMASAALLGDPADFEGFGEGCERESDIDSVRIGGGDAQPPRAARDVANKAFWLLGYPPWCAGAACPSGCARWRSRVLWLGLALLPAETARVEDCSNAAGDSACPASCSRK